MNIELLTVKGAATQLAVSVKTVRRLIDAGKLKHKRIGRCIRIDARDVTSFILSAEPAPPARRKRRKA